MGVTDLPGAPGAARVFVGGNVTCESHTACYHVAMSETHSIFDVIGPIMVGPSSSHTAGAVRLGALARAIFGGQPTSATIGLHGSFAATGEGHGTKVALAAGLLGWAPDDLRIPEALEYAKREGMAVQFHEVNLDAAHPNTAVFELAGTVEGQPQEMRIVGSSVGGGNVMVSEIDSFHVRATGDLPLVVVEHIDQPGVIHFVSGILAENRINIAAMRVSREHRGARALMLIETDLKPDRVTLARMMKRPQVLSVRYVPAI